MISTLAKRCYLLLAAVLLAGCLVPPAMANQDFVNWLHAFYPQARQQGISEQTLNQAFSGVTEPDELVLDRAAYQPEFVQALWEYLDSRVNRIAVANGLVKEDQYAATLTRLEERFGVDRTVLLAIWSMETSYGAVLAKRERLHYIPQALATLGWGDPKRSGFARKQLVAALEILQNGDVRPRDMLGSWAGAMGHTQFIPTSYLAYAVDIDDDGKKDIWHSIPDALGTAANLLARNGWRSGRTWGYEVILPTGSGRWAEQTKTLGEWQRLGLIRPGGKPFFQPEDKAILKVLAGENGPGFLMLKNFFVIKRYNNSDKYALAVGLLADRLAGYDGMSRDWPRPADALSADEKIELQQLLKAKGYYQGEIDGQLGSGSRAAIREFEIAAGLQVNGLPSRKLLDALRK
ncbi:MAG: lytic murein transglycosylase [Desulfopila sp.]